MTYWTKLKNLLDHISVVYKLIFISEMFKLLLLLVVVCFVLGCFVSYIVSCVCVWRGGGGLHANKINLTMTTVLYLVNLVVT